jgi:hypothetical protein
MANHCKINLTARDEGRWKGAMVVSCNRVPNPHNWKSMSDSRTKPLAARKWRSGRLGAKVWLGTLMALLLTALPGPSWGAGTVTAVVNVEAALASSAQLTLNPTTINFPNASPDTVPSIPSTQNPVQVTARVTTGVNKTVPLTALAQGDLVSGSNTIAISNVTWTASGNGFSDGTMNKSTAQSVGRWRGSGTYSGTLSFFLHNSWSYATGNYTQRVTFTLTAP